MNEPVPLSRSFGSQDVDEQEREQRIRRVFEQVAARYDLCEDMACTLVEHAQTMQFDQGLSEAEVLGRCHQGLLAESSVVTGKEAVWVICRLAELLSWPCPEFENNDRKALSP